MAEDTTNKNIKALLEKTEGNTKRTAKREETLLEAVKLGNKIEDLNSRGESKRADALQGTMDAVLATLENSNTSKALDNRLSEIVNLNDQANNILESQKNAIEGDATVNSLKKLTEELSGQKDLIELQTKAQTDGKKALNKLSMTTEAGDPLLDELKSSFTNSQTALESALESGDQQQIDLAQAQLEAVLKGIQTEEERREALKKQDEANSLLANMADKIESGNGKVAKTAGFLAGIAGIATLFFSPETFGAIVRKAIDTVGAIVDTIDKFISGDMEGMRETIDENFKEFAVILGSLGLMILPKVLRAIRFLKNTFMAFKTFMVSDFVANMMANLKSMMASLGGAFMKLFRGLVTLTKVFRGFMMATFIPTMIAAFSGMMAAMVPIIAAMAPILVPILAIMALVGALYLGFKALQDSLGPGASIMDTLKVAMLYFVDFLAMIVNGITFIPRKILGFLGPRLMKWIMGDDFDTSVIDNLSKGFETNRGAQAAEEIRLKNQKAADEAAMAKEQEEARQKDQQNLTGADIPDISTENALAQVDVQQNPVVVSNQQSSNVNNSSSVTSNIISGRPLRSSGLSLSFSR